MASKAKTVGFSAVSDAAVTADGVQVLTLTPLDPGIVFEKIVVDFGGYKNSYLFGNESPNKR
jgi:hypothetical protein